MSNRRLDPGLVARQIANILLQYPELEGEDDETWKLILQSETDTFETLRAVECKRQEAAMFSGGVASNIARLQERQARFERRELAMRELALRIMQAADIRKAELAEATLSIRNGTPKVLITDEHQIPDDYYRVRRELDRAKLSAALKSGCEVTGAVLSNSEPALSIRTK